MTRYRVVVTADAEGDLDAIYEHIAISSGESRATSVIGSLVGTCLALDTFPQRGTPRDDILSGLCVIAHRRRASIAFTVDGSTVTIEGVLWRGRDVAAALVRKR